MASEFKQENIRGIVLLPVKIIAEISGIGISADSPGTNRIGQFVGVYQTIVIPDISSPSVSRSQDNIGWLGLQVSDQVERVRCT